jgi:hypothetical protein
MIILLKRIRATYSIYLRFSLEPDQRSLRGERSRPVKATSSVKNMRTKYPIDPRNEIMEWEGESWCSNY